MEAMAQVKIDGLPNWTIDSMVIFYFAVLNSIAMLVITREKTSLYSIFRESMAEWPPHMPGI